jgi:DNA-binding transcriptional LysR family regulator
LTPLRTARPERTLHLRFGDSADLLAALRRGDVDACVTSVRISMGSLQYSPLHEEGYTFVAAVTLANERPLHGPGDAAHHTLLDAHPDLPLFRYLLDALPGAALWRFARTELLGTIAAIRHRVLEGAGVAVLPRYFVADDVAAGRLVELMPHVGLARDTFRLLWRDDHPLRVELLALAEELRGRPVQ